MPSFKPYKWKEANFKIATSYFELVTAEIRKQRTILDDYIQKTPEFRDSLTPITFSEEAPEIICRMSRAAELTGLGPMAAVAGTVSQMAVEAVLEVYPDETVIVENGGDIYLSGPTEITIGLYAGEASLSDKLALKISSEAMPLSVCSSSGNMGHSLSMGRCDLATVISKDASVADAAATLAANLVKEVEDIQPVLEKVENLKGVQGVLIVKGDSIGIAGDMPEIIRNRDKQLVGKVTRAE